MQERVEGYVVSLIKFVSVCCLPQTWIMHKKRRRNEGKYETW